MKVSVTHTERNHVTTHDQQFGSQFTCQNQVFKLNGGDDILSSRVVGGCDVIPFYAHPIESYLS